MNKPERTHWLYQKRNLPKLWGVLVLVLVITLIPEFFIDHHHNFEQQGVHIDASWGFYIWYAFMSCVAMVVIAKILGVFLKRPEDYYDD